MSGALAVALYGLVLLAVAGGGVGVWLMVQSAREGRLMARRLARAETPEPAAVETDEPEAAGPLAAALEKHAPWLGRRLASAGAPFTPVQVAAGSLMLTAAFAVTLRVLGVGWLIATPVAAWAGMAGPLALISWLAARRRAAFLAQMPQTVDLIARSLQAGHPVSTAMAVAAQQMPAPIGPEFKKVLAEVSLGLDRDRALRNMLRRFPLAELQLFAASLEVTRETGGNIAEVFLKLGDTMRSKAQLRRKVDALAAEGKLSFWVISALPVLVVGALMMLQPRYYAEVAGDPLFWPMMSVPPILLATGAAIIWRMINIKV